MTKFISSVFIVLFSISVSANDNPPKKQLIAFSSDASKNDKQQIFVMDTDGNGVKQVSFINLDCYAPVFSPDGKKIIFNAFDANKNDYLYMVNLEDTSTFSFPVFVDGGADPHYSFDGQYLLYRSEKNIDNNIYIMELSTDSSSIISDGSLSTHAEFSNDGNKIIFSSSMEGNFDIVVLDLTDTTENAQVTVANSKDAEIYGTFSPDDKMIAYASFDINYKGTVWVCDSKGKSNKQISRGLGSSYNPKFSPGGTKLAFISGTEKTTLYICNTDGSGLKQLTTAGSTTEFDWSPDGKSIVYESKKETVSSINIINIETGKSENLTGEKANNVTPSYQPIAN